MDEPTSALDPKQELQINRLSTISGADYIYLIHKEAIEEAGTHQELMEKQGHYARIYHAQAELYSF